MHLEIARAWSVLLIRGICNVLFALVAFLQPELTLLTLVLVWGVYAVVDGAMALTTGIAARRGGGHDWSLVAAGRERARRRHHGLRLARRDARAVARHHVGLGHSFAARSRSRPRSGCAMSCRAAGCWRCPVRRRFSLASC